MSITDKPETLTDIYVQETEDELDPNSQCKVMLFIFVCSYSTTGDGIEKTVVMKRTVKN